MRTPDDLDEIPPSPQLAEVLAGLPAEQIANGDVVAVMCAAYRQATHSRMLFLQLVHEVAVRLPGPHEQVCRGTAAEVDEFAADEIAAALTWSRTRAQTTLGLAVETLDRLPAVGAAMLTGRIDEPRAKAFCDWTVGLSDEHTTAVIDEVLPAAPDMTVGQLCEAIQRTAIALDPGWAQRRYDESVRHRRVVLAQGPEGTTSLAGYELPADRAVAGHTRIAVLARRCKRAGDRRAIDAIRADLYLGMLDGTLHGLADEEIVAHVLAHPIAGDPVSDDTDDASDVGGRATGAPGSSAEGTDDPGDIGPGTSGAPDDGPGGDDGRPGGSGGSGGPGGRGGPAQSMTWCPAELRVRLGTLLGLNDHPAELPGYGYVPAAGARQLAARMAAGQWRYVVCSPDGLPIDTGALRSRPVLPGVTIGRDARGGLFELQLTTSELDTLRQAATGAHADWARVLDEIASAHVTKTADAHAEVANGHTARRFADARLRRWVQVRDRSCVFPGCRAPAAQADQDHRIDYAAGGTTAAENLESLCRHHHRLKHDGRWRLDRHGELAWVWTSRLGRRYRAQPPPVMPPLPKPVRIRRSDSETGHWSLQPR